MQETGYTLAHGLITLNVRTEAGEKTLPAALYNGTTGEEALRLAGPGHGESLAGTNKAGPSIGSCWRSCPNPSLQVERLRQGAGQSWPPCPLAPRVRNCPPAWGPPTIFPPP